MTEDGQIISGDRRKLIEADERIEVRPTASKLEDNILDQFESVSMNYTVNGKEVSTLGTRAPTSTF